MKKIFSFLFVALFSVSLWAVDTWTVAGNNTTLFGTAWAPSLETNDMSWVSGNIYQWSKADVSLTAGTTVEFKIVQNHSWDNEAWPNPDNFSLYIPHTTTYTVTILFNSDTKEITAEAAPKTVTLYFVNTENWADDDVKAYVWYKAGNSDIIYKAWSGEKMTKTGETTANGYPIYSYTFPEVYTKVIFSKDGADNAKTGDLTWDDDEPYYVYNTGAWYASKAAIPTPTVKVSANWGASGAWEDLTLTADDGGLTASSSKTFTAAQLGSYELGVKVNEAWKSNGSDEYISRNNDEIAITGISGNMNILIDVAAEITFTWNYATNTLTVTYPSLPANPVIAAKGYWSSAVSVFTDNGDGTASMTRNLVKGTYTFYMLHNGSKRCLDGNNHERYTFHRNWTSDVIAGCGTEQTEMLINTDIPGSYTFTWTYESDLLTITFPDSLEIEFHLNFKWGESNWELKQLSESADSWYTTNLTISETGTYEYEIRKYDPNHNDPVTTWYHAENYGATMTSDNCTNWQLTTSTDYHVNLNASKTGSYTFEFNAATAKMNVVYPNATAIDNTEVGEKAVKRIENGQLVIIKNGVRYNALGAEVK